MVAKRLLRLVVSLLARWVAPAAFRRLSLEFLSRLAPVGFTPETTSFFGLYPTPTTNILGWILPLPTLFLLSRPSRATNLHDTGSSDGCIPIPRLSHAHAHIIPRSFVLPELLHLRVLDAQ
jgi:hypothetical protein